MLATLLTGCGTAGFYAQAIRGEYQILSRQQPIHKLLESPKTSPPLKARLKLALEIREFAQRDLRLPANGHYRHYADLGRRFAVWTVYAAPEFSLEAKSWWYPVVGRLEYRGYFDERKALRCARRLEQRGLDVHVGGAEAYSTLGWFRDPVLNTFLFDDDVELAELLFHELAHQRLFIAGDTEFNEAFATAVAEEGVERWLRSRGNAAQIAARREASARKQTFLTLVAGARARLAELYQQGGAGDCSCARERECDCGRVAMRARKAMIFDKLQADYVAARAAWGGQSDYDGWFRQPLNNALINTVETYYALVPAFRQVVAADGGDLEAFFQHTAALAKLTREQRRRSLRELAR